MICILVRLHICQEVTRRARGGWWWQKPGANDTSGVVWELDIFILFSTFIFHITHLPACRVRVGVGYIGQGYLEHNLYPNPMKTLQKTHRFSLPVPIPNYGVFIISLKNILGLIFFHLDHCWFSLYLAWLHSIHSAHLMNKFSRFGHMLPKHVYSQC
jgi:hypothetical protein